MFLRTTLLPLLLILAFPLSGDIKVIIGGNASPPFRIFEGREPSGLYIDIIRLAVKNLGWTLEFQEMPLARALVQMDEGKIDMMLGPNRTPDRELFMIYLTQVPFPKERKIILVPLGAKLPGSLTDLEGKTVGVLRGAVYTAAFDQNERIRKYTVGDYLQGLQMTAAKRLDALIIPEKQAEPLLALHPLPLSRAPFTLEGSDSYITVSRKSPVVARIPELVKALEKIKDSREYGEILKKYSY